MQKAAHIILLCMFIFSASVCFAQSETSEATASISGRVTIDGNPARGITVQAISFDKSATVGWQQKLGIRAAPKTVTSVDGSFRLNNLASGRYLISPSAPSMVGIRESEDSVQPQIITLKAGATVEGINLSLIRGGVITGRITYEDGSPVIAAHIICSRDEALQQTSSSRSFTFNFFEHQSFRTDDRGVYRIYGLPEGNYTIRVMLDVEQLIKSRQHLQEVYYPNTTEVTKAASIEVKNGVETQDIDIRLGAPNKLYTIAGRALDADTGKPLTDVSIVCVLKTIAGGYATNRIKTNKKGEFLFEDMPSGSYHAQIFKSQGRSDEYYSETTYFEVQNADVSDVEIKRHKGLTISGKIVFDGATDFTNAATLRQLQLQADSYQIKNNKEVFSAASYAEISPDGKFIFKGLSPGSIIIDLLSESRFVLLGIERNGVEARPFELPKGETVNDLLITVAEIDCAVRGQVIIEGGILPDNAMLHISARRITSDPPDPHDFRFFKSSISVTPDNHFTIADLIAGKYEVTLIAEVRTQDRINRWITKQKVSVESRQTADATIKLDLNANKEK